jgi:hypothetical protein
MEFFIIILFAKFLTLKLFWKILFYFQIRNKSAIFDIRFSFCEKIVCPNSIFSKYEKTSLPNNVS